MKYTMVDVYSRMGLLMWISIISSYDAGQIDDIAFLWRSAIAIALWLVLPYMKNSPPTDKE